VNRISKNDLVPLFMGLRDLMLANRDRLIELDGKVGDSDLGLTMCKAFAAAFDSVSANTVDGIGRTILLAGMAVSKAAPSTMGTLIATGFMRGGKALDGAGSISTPEMSRFWESFLVGVMERGKAKRGDKTIVDVLAPVSDSLAASASKGETLESAMASAAIAAATGLEAAKHMMAQHGKAACFREKTIGLQDAGATVAFLMIDTLKTFVLENK
jgi:dihydroxyacetone kinase-like protein